MVQRSSGYGQFARIGAFRKVTASVAFGGIVRIRDRTSKQRERFCGDAGFRREPVDARTYDRAPDGPRVDQQDDRPSIEHRSRNRQVACETHLLEADGPEPGPSGLSSINARPPMSVESMPASNPRLNVDATALSHAAHPGRISPDGRSFGTGWAHLQTASAPRT